jgi:hypothetical protein
MIIRKDVYLKDKNRINNKLEGSGLYFEPKDIKYVIIKSESEIKEFIDVLRDTKGIKYSYNDVERLMTRLITADQILSDF